MHFSKYARTISCRLTYRRIHTQSILIVTKGRGKVNIYWERMVGQVLCEALSHKVIEFFLQPWRDGIINPILQKWKKKIMGGFEKFNSLCRLAAIHGEAQSHGGLQDFGIPFRRSEDLITRENWLLPSHMCRIHRAILLWLTLLTPSLV